MRIGHRIAMMSGGVLLILMIVGLVSYTSVSRLVEASQWVVHTEMVLRELENFGEVAAEAERLEAAYTRDVLVTLTRAGGRRP